MRNRELRNRILETLSETPLINYACKKAGISRMTFYRWRKDNVDFRKEADRLLALGRENVVEMAEAALIKNIKEGRMDAIRFYLQNNDPKYMAKRTFYVEPPKPKKVLKPGDICDECGEPLPKPKSFQEMAESLKMFTDKEYTKDDHDGYLHDFEKNHRHPNHGNEYERKGGFRIVEKSAYETGEDDLESN